jgi:hypothetical protein
MKFAYSVGIGPIKLGFTHEELMSLRNRFRKNPIYDGPCMILNRANGLALDAGPDSKVGDTMCSGPLTLDRGNNGGCGKWAMRSR